MFDGRRSKLGHVQNHRKQKKIGYPILFDCGGRMFEELGLRGYPTAFLIDRDGKVIWEGILSGKKTRKTVQELIERRVKRSQALMTSQPTLGANTPRNCSANPVRGPTITDCPGA